MVKSKKTYHIAIEAGLLAAAQTQATGLAVYLDRLLSAISASAPQEYRFFLLHTEKEWKGKDYGAQFEPVSYSFKCGIRFSSQFLAIAFHLNACLKRIQADLFHVTCTTGAPFLHPGIPILSTVHDLYPLLFPYEVPLKNHLLFRILWSWTRKNSDYFLCNSAFTASELYKSGISPKKTMVTTLAPQCDFRDLPTEHRDAVRPPLDGRDYILCTGALEKRKGQHFLLKAYLDALQQNPDLPDLVFIGPDRGDGKKIMRCNSSKVHYLKFLPREEWIRFFINARLFVFPSFYEGFGLPVLEAASAGLPVLAADIPVLREVGGQYPIYVPPTLPDFSAALLHYFADRQPETQADRMRRAEHLLADYSWEKTARQTLNAYANLLS